jgi:hypothetical protein
MGQVQRLYEPLTEWQMRRLPQRADGYTLDLDSTSTIPVATEVGSGHYKVKGRHSPFASLGILVI